MHLYAYMRGESYIPVYESPLITSYNGYTYYRIDSNAYICIIYALCRFHTGYESSLITVYNGYTYYHIDADASICMVQFMCMCKLVSGMCNMTKLWGYGVPTLVRDHYSLRLCRLLSCTHYPTSPDYLVPNFATARWPPPTWELPIYVPESPASSRGHPPTWASSISIPASPTFC